MARAKTMHDQEEQRLPRVLSMRLATLPCFPIEIHRIFPHVIQGKTHSMFLIHLHFSHQNIDSKSYLKYENQTENLENIPNKV